MDKLRDLFGKVGAGAFYVAAIVIAYLLKDSVSMNLSFLVIHLAVGGYWLNRAVSRDGGGAYNPGETDPETKLKALLVDRMAVESRLGDIRQLLFMASILMMIFAWGNFSRHMDIDQFERRLDRVCAVPSGSRETKMVCSNLLDDFYAIFRSVD